MSAPEGRLAQHLVAIAACVAYVATAARHVLGGDNGELAMLAANGGVAHPPGYPLYVLYLRAMRWLPAASPAHAAALATCLLGVASVVAMQRACAAWGASPASAALVSAAYAFSPLAWTLGTHAEVFTLNALIAMLIVAVAAPACTMRPYARAAALGLLAGLGLANHHSIVLLTPVGLFAVVESARAAPSRARAVGAAIAAFAVGLLPYTYLVYVARNADPASVFVWGDTRDLPGVLRHFMRAQYGTTKLGIKDYPGEPLAQLAALSRHALIDLLGLPVLAAIGAVVALARHVRSPHRWAVVALVISLACAGPLFVMRFNVPPRDVGALIAERFYLLPEALLCVLAALAVDVVLAAVGARAAIATLVTAPVAAAAAALSYPRVVRHHDGMVELYVRNVLAIAPERAIVLGTGDDRFGAFLYARYALRLRRDVTFVNPSMLLVDWYADRASRDLGYEVERGRMVPGHDVPQLDARALVAQALDTGRPVFVTDWFARGLDRFAPSYPIGPLIRIVPDPRELPAPSALEAMNLDAARVIEIAPATDDDRKTWGGLLQEDYARPWIVLSSAFRSTGDSARADACAARARVIAPWISTP